MLLAEDFTKENNFDVDEYEKKPAYKAARRNAIVGINYGISELSDSLGLNSLEMTGISIATESLFNGATGNNNFMTDFSSTVNNRISNFLSSVTQTAINSSLNGQPLDLDLGSLALSSSSNSIGTQIFHNLGLMLNQPEFKLDLTGLNIQEHGTLASAIDENRNALVSTLDLKDLENVLDATVGNVPTIKTVYEQYKKMYNIAAYIYNNPARPFGETLVEGLQIEYVPRHGNWGGRGYSGGQAYVEDLNNPLLSALVNTLDYAFMIKAMQMELFMLQISSWWKL